MLPKINGKSFMDCTEEDLQVLIDNTDFRENEYIDYKSNFAFLECEKGQKRDDKLAEFRSDICAFANAEGGYLFFGIAESNGCATEILGIEIQNDDTDHFELVRRNNMMAILPRPPYVQFNFIKLQNGRYVVIIFVQHDGFAPYVHIENDKNYRIFKRVGNGKKTMSYAEMRNMFNQSVSLDKEILSYRKERINYYLEQNPYPEQPYPEFFVLHIIPETFLDSSYNQNMMILERSNGRSFSRIFGSFRCNSYSIPCCDGLRFTSYREDAKLSDCYIFNNGVVECSYDISTEIHNGILRILNYSIVSIIGK